MTLWYLSVQASLRFFPLLLTLFCAFQACIFMMLTAVVKSCESAADTQAKLEKVTAAADAANQEAVRKNSATSNFQPPGLDGD
jgi:hypothetical protein